MSKVFLVLSMFTFSLIVNTGAQDHIRFNHLTIEDGLSQSAVTCIFQDKNGFMWFGTQDGLNRYDGYNFKVFKNDPENPNSLTDNFIFSIYEDDSGTIYIGTQSGNLHEYDPKKESFTVVSSDSIDLSKTVMSSVLAVYYDKSNIKWIGGLSQETGLKMENKETGEVKTFIHDPNNKSSLSNNKVYSILRDSKGSLWIGTFDGLNKLEEKTGRFLHYKYDPADPNSISDNFVWPIYEDSRGILWVGTVRGGLCKFDPQSNSFVNYKNDPADPTSLNDNYIFSIYEDRSGVIWIGTNTGGLNYFHPSSQVFEHYVNNVENKNSLSDNDVIAMNVDANGVYWIGTRNAGLDKFDHIRKEFKNYSHDPAISNSLVSNSVQSIYEDKSGILWLGTFSNGLDAFDPRSETFTHYIHNPSDPHTLTDNRIYALIEDNDNNIWIGTYGGGLNKLDRKTGKISNFQSDENDTTSISSNATWSIAKDQSGNLWIGTFGGGVNIFDHENQTFAHLKNNPDDSTSISDNNIIRVFKDSKGTMWFGTTKGLSRYSNETNNFKNYNETDGLSNNFVYGIAEDGNGNLWLSTNNGLSKFNPIDQTFKNYYYEDGLQGNEFNQNAYARDHKTGRLLFGGLNGFNVFHPDSVTENNYVPPIVFTDYIRYNTDDEEGKPIFEKGISERDSILLTYKDNIVSLEFAALSYYNNLMNQYRYKLEGFNENWIQLGYNHTVTFTNLSPGDYNLRVIGSNSDGLWNEKGASLFIEVTPPWWRTNIAYTIYGIIFIGILLGIRKFENDRREQKAKMRETELRMKATEAEKRAIEIESERKTKELEEARQLQLSMLPKELPELPNLEIAAFMRTATEVGGDYYDFIVQENGILNVAFGDATGHGLQAGTMVTLMKGFFTSDSSKLGIKEFMNHCSKMIKEIKLGRILMSFSYLKFENSKLYITSAGMPPIYYYNKSAEVIEEIVMKGMPLGAMANFPYKIHEKVVKSGDIILLLTDGIPEQMNENEEMYDYPRVKDQFVKVAEKAPSEIIDHFIKSCDNWMGSAIQADDITIMVIRIK
ncbi:MAG: SpoIIE family protein phosphatase [Bacteroidetes bacterium]|nr:SpoIIE family protein phosphatase [Bacteroidota bacterium]